MQVYLGKITLTSKYCLSIHFGSDPTTSARPPVFMKGTPSDATKRIFFIINPPTIIVTNYYTSSLLSIKDNFENKYAKRAGPQLL
jgi:hypothetical protein